MSPKNNLPMDDTMPEADTLAMTPNSPRNVWALETLVEEVARLFPDVTYETSNTDGRNANHDVQFVIDAGSDEDLVDLLGLIEDDRIADIIIEDDSTDGVQVLVQFVFNAVLQDNRDSFGLSDAYDVMIDSDRS